MIVADASAIVAVLLEEPEEDAFLDVLSQGPVVMSPVGYWEAHTRVHRLRGDEGAARLERLLTNFDIQIAPAGSETARLAARAQAEFGKHTPAKLNLGDCFAYALAKERNLPLLFKGEDFVRTDVEVALRV